MKNPFVIVGTVFALGILALVLFGGGSEKIEPAPEGALLRPAAPEGKRMINSTDGFVEVPDITINPIAEYEGGVRVIAKTSGYSILYYAQDDFFMVSLLDGNNFASSRVEAEQAFLTTLAVTEAQACALNVDLVVPPYIDFNRAGSYGLSYCVNSILIPDNSPIQ